MFLAALVVLMGFSLLAAMGPDGSTLGSTRQQFIGSVIGTLLTAVGLVWAEASCRWILRDSLLLSAREGDQVSAATEWVGWWGLGPAHPPRDESAMVLVAQDVMTSIRTSSAWADQCLDVSRVRLDLGEERREIIRGAFRLSRLTAETAALSVAEVGGPAVARLHAAVDQRAAMVHDTRCALVERVAALHRYRQGLAPLEALLHNIDLVRELEAEQPDLAAVYADIVSSEQAVADMAALSTELVDLEAGLLVRIDYLRAGIVKNFELTTPLALTVG